MSQPTPHRETETRGPTLDARWIIALWAAIHGRPADAPGELVLAPEALRQAAGSAILALASQLDADTAHRVAAALATLPDAAQAQSEAEVEDALKRLGIRLYQRAGAGLGLSVAGFGKFCWPDTPA